MVLRLRYPAPGNWRKAKCHGNMDDSFLPEDQKSFGPAVEFCNGTSDGVVCPIRTECMLFALTNNCKIGVWGGTTPVTRKALRKVWPLRRGKLPRPEWRWMTEEQALAMVNGELPEDDDDDDEDEG